MNAFTLNLGDLLALAGMVVSAGMFFWLATVARPDHITIEKYLLAGRTMRSTEFGATFVAGSTSLATVLMFFINTNEVFGLTLLFCGVTYFAGQALFINFLRKSPIDSRKFTTNADFLLERSGSPALGRTVAILTAISFLVILFVEIYLGASILSYYLRQSTRWGSALGYLAIGLIVVGYTRIGGMKAVTSTDLWQYRMMILGVLAFLGAAIFFVGAQPNRDIDWNAFVTFKSPWSSVLVFWSWILVLNITLPFTQLSSWQRIGACATKEEAWKGMLKTMTGFFMIWWLPILTLALFKAKGHPISSLDGLFDLLRASGGIVGVVLYPLLFVGFTAALFSTADTALIALQLALADKSTFGNTFATGHDRKLRRFLQFGSIGVMALLAGIFLIAQADLGKLFMPLVFMLFGQLTVLAPQMFYYLRRSARGLPLETLSGKGGFAVIFGIVVAWSILLVTTWLKTYGKIPELGTQEAATWVALLVSAIGQVVGVKLSRKH